MLCLFSSSRLQVSAIINPQKYKSRVRVLGSTPTQISTVRKLSGPDREEEKRPAPREQDGRRII